MPQTFGILKNSQSHYHEKVKKDADTKSKCLVHFAM